MMMMMMLRLRWRWVVLIGELKGHRLSQSRPGGFVESRWTGLGGLSIQTAQSEYKTKQNKIKQQQNRDSQLIRETTWTCWQFLIWVIWPRRSPKWECFLCLMSPITSCPSSTSSMSQVSVFSSFSVRLKVSCHFLKWKICFMVWFVCRCTYMSHMHLLTTCL